MSLEDILDKFPPPPSFETIPDAPPAIPSSQDFQKYATTDILNHPWRRLDPAVPSNNAIPSNTSGDSIIEAMFYPPLDDLPSHPNTALKSLLYSQVAIYYEIVKLWASQPDGYESIVSEKSNQLSLITKNISKILFRLRIYSSKKTLMESWEQETALRVQLIQQCKKFINGDAESSSGMTMDLALDSETQTNSSSS